MSQKKWIRILVIMTILIIGSSFYYLPYYVTKPGSAKDLDSIIEVENGFEDEGRLMLTTVRMGKANIYTYLIASLRKYEHIYPAGEVRSPEETDEEYNVRQLHLMETSKLNAIEVAFKHADKPYSFDYNGVYILNVYPGMPADEVLKPGDMITAIDGNAFSSSQEFIDYISKKTVDDTVKITFTREGEVFEEEVPLAEFSASDGKVGLGIGLVDDKDIVTETKVTMNTEKIGGPSAGLMFSLQLYNGLVEKDITRGIDIAGTGTISSNGTVGRIGGIEQKVIAADNAGAEIFFAPMDIIPEDIKKSNPDLQPNYEEALKTAKEIGTDMEIVPVKTFEDALNYLDSI
ncbi:SepM family pheromone-processing serine protease [Bacillus sp. P14.5]|uniref:SepM family pheromone-processing serine protease n=1 Tax=Bacillus sp. P14.5 TaxID=1983400 RepID=UPI001F05D89D|nr:SepM family pheromone-processing serine protease [Bacillus sp. P14.5]